jgi:folate-binding protein YgfZ
VTPSAATGAAAAEGYGRIRAGEPTAVRGSGAVIWVEGPDAAGFLQGLLTNDVAALADGEGCPALMLDAKGHVLAEARVHRDGPDSFTVLADAAHGDDLAELLERYHFSEDLEIIGPEPVGTVVLAGVAAPGAGVAVPGPVPGTVEIVADDPAAAIAAAGAREAPPEALEMARIAAGVARVGVDTAETTLVQEAALEERTVSFDKGCYLGQETVARLQFRGRANRRLRGLRLPDPAPSAGAALHAGGREVGRLTSVAVTPDLGAIGLAIVRREVEDGAEVVIEGADAPARVVALPFGGGR